MSKSPVIWIRRQLLDSLAFRSLKTPSCFVVLGALWQRRQMEKFGGKQKRTDNYVVTNNGEITLHYGEAKRKYGISAGQFSTAIRELERVGFLDVVSGQGVRGVPNLYTLSERWRHFGTDAYEPPKKRKCGPVNRGFQPGNQHGRNCGKKKNPTVTDQHKPSVTDQHKPPVSENLYVDGPT